jgi:hypothetical protein
MMLIKITKLMGTKETTFTLKTFKNMEMKKMSFSKWNKTEWRYRKLSESTSNKRLPKPKRIKQK